MKRVIFAALPAVVLATSLMSTPAQAATPPPTGVDGVIGAEWAGVTPIFVPYCGFLGPSPPTWYGQLVGFNVYGRVDANYLYMAFEAKPMNGDQWNDAWALSLWSSANVYLDTDANGSSDLVILSYEGNYCKADGTNCVFFGDPVTCPGELNCSADGLHGIWMHSNPGAPGAPGVGGVREIAISWDVLRTDPDHVGFPPTKCNLILRTVQAFGYNFSGSQLGPNRFGKFTFPGCPPPPPKCKRGDGDDDFEDDKGRKHHGHFHHDSCEDGPGDVEDDDGDSGKHFESTSISSATFTSDADSQILTMTGTGLDDGVPVGFTMVAVDYGGVTPAVYTLTLTSGRTFTGTMVSGSLLIR